ncbi:hypothetical protein AVEN_203304-1, partial [Araneus ventricosus]
MKLKCIIILHEFYDRLERATKLSDVFAPTQFPEKSRVPCLSAANRRGQCIWWSLRRRLPG